MRIVLMMNQWIKYTCFLSLFCLLGKDACSANPTYLKKLIELQSRERLIKDFSGKFFNVIIQEIGKPTFASSFMVVKPNKEGEKKGSSKLIAQLTCSISEKSQKEFESVINGAKAIDGKDVDMSRVIQDKSYRFDFRKEGKISLSLWYDEASSFRKRTAIYDASGHVRAQTFYSDISIPAATNQGIVDVKVIRLESLRKDAFLDPASGKTYDLDSVYDLEHFSINLLKN